MKAERETEVKNLLFSKGRLGAEVEVDRATAYTGESLNCKYKFSNFTTNNEVHPRVYLNHTIMANIN